MSEDKLYIFRRDQIAVNGVTGYKRNMQYVGEAFPLGDHRYAVAETNKPPYILDMETGKIEEFGKPE